ncbi:MAG: MgtC/SapB family protein [Candidatus Aenigmatarchaeota archaeon]
MIIPELLQQVLIALAIGGLVGVERESLPAKKFVGLRTTALLAMVGPLAVEATKLTSSVLPVILYLASGISLSLFIIYVRLKVEENDIGLTTSMGVLVIVFTSLLVGYAIYFEAVAVAIIATFLLAGKGHMKKYTNELTNDEVLDALKLAAVAFVIYPLLPSQTVTSLGLINPQKVLLFIIFVLLIRFAAFVATRKMTERSGLALTGFLGGMASSFAAVASISEISGEGENVKPAVFGILMASAAMVIRNLVIVSVSSMEMLYYLLLPSVLMIAVSSLPTFLSLKKKSSETGNKIKESIKSPLSFKPAIKLGVYFVAITVFGGLVQHFLGQQGLWLVAIAGGVISSAALTISMVSMAGAGTIAAQTAVALIIVASISSIVVKIVLSRTAGNRKLCLKALPYHILIALAGVIPLLLIF